MTDDLTPPPHDTPAPARATPPNGSDWFAVGVVILAVLALVVAAFTG